MQRDSIGLAHNGMKMDMLDTDGRLGMGSLDMDQRMRDEAQDLAKMSNEMCEQKDRLLYSIQAE